MNLSERAARAADEAIGILGASPDEGTNARLRQALEKAIIDAVLVEQERCAGVAKACCAADMDMAHKVETEIQQTRDTLIANLSAMR